MIKSCQMTAGQLYPVPQATMPTLSYITSLATAWFVLFALFERVLLSIKICTLTNYRAKSDVQTSVNFCSNKGKGRSNEYMNRHFDQAFLECGSLVPMPYLSRGKGCGDC